jgi:hypothetical protein
MNLKIYAQLEKQMLKDGKKSIFKSLRSVKKTLAQHEKKRGIYIANRQSNFQCKRAD